MDLKGVFTNMELLGNVIISVECKTMDSFRLVDSVSRKFIWSFSLSVHKSRAVCRRLEMIASVAPTMIDQLCNIFLSTISDESMNKQEARIFIENKFAQCESQN